MADISLTSSTFEHNLESPVRSGDHIEEDEDDIQISLAPYIQTYLAQTGRRISCFGIGLPVPFERAAQRSWWDPRFDSEILEGQYRTSSFPQVQLRFQFALIYILVSSVTWFVYFLSIGLHGSADNWGFMPASFAVLFLSNLGFLILTYTDIYRRFNFQVSLSVAVLNGLISLLFVVVYPATSQPDISPVGQFTMAVITLLITYTVIPLPLYICVIIESLYSVLFEGLSVHLSHVNENPIDHNEFLVRALLHICVHFIGIHILIMTNVRMRGTFMKVGQSLLVRRQLEKEKSLKEKMIFSVMPPKVARWLIHEGGGQDNDDVMRGNDFGSLFRPFNMVRMENVSILFADIVGFTRMSSNKSAEELVGILNDLFERFDELCVSNGCEKISTLGDCYYCVSGCPEPRADHAKSCVEMGLGMIDAIQQFDVERNEGVTMRVGVHTGTVLCGIVGTKRFKFDVWSNDVTLANQMESSGKPGQVHVSQATLEFLGEDYVVEPGESVYGIRTYFIIGRKKSELSTTDFEKTTIPDTSGTPSSSPIRPRVSSFNQGNPKSKRPHYLQLLANPPTQGKASSMPSMLGDDREPLETTGDHMKPMIRKTGTSSASCGRFSPKSSGFLKNSGKNRRKSETIPLDTSSPKMKRPYADSIQDLLVSPLIVPAINEDRLSVCRSTNSRKDSGIRSNSHRSSIQHQIFAMNGLTQGENLHQRVSGYYTSSQSSFDDADSDIRRSHLPPPLGENFGACFQKLRKQSDLQLIRCVQDNVTSHRSYFVKPPLSDISLFFRQSEMEREYRANAHRGTEKHGTSLPTLATSRFNTYFDVVISAFVYSVVSTSLFLLYEASTSWIVVFILATLVQFFAIFLCLRQLWRSKRMALHKPPDLAKRILDRFSSWYPWHFCGGILVSLPVVAILSNFCCLRMIGPSNYTFSYLMFVGLVHFCNFTQLNCWMKSSLASFTGILYVILVITQSCHPIAQPNAQSNIWQIISTFGPGNSSIGFQNSTGIVSNYSSLLSNLTFEDSNESLQNSSLPFGISNNSFALNASILDNGTDVTNPTDQLATGLTSSMHDTELIVDVVLILLLVWFLNREFEISYRLSFHSNFVAARDKTRVQSMKNQADWLLHNIIPKHVADQLKNTAKYSENHKDVGVIFASIVNFNEMYDESFMGGREFLRVLNELIGDFDELLTKPEFSNVEKIKTIGSTFMAASGLNPAVRRQSSHPNQHLFELMDFAIALQKVVDSFNQDLLEFALVLRIGYNFGDVTAGVIGTSKLYYDIWGDAVNIASRMDSTGVCGRIQVGSSCAQALEEKFEFEPRGSVYVKGKDNMNVFLLTGKRDDDG